MSRRRAEIQVFSMSFLDVLSCALGGVLLLLLLNMDSSQKAAAEYASEAEAWKQQATDMQKRIDDTIADLRTAEEESKKAKQAQAALIGWEGKLKNVVFIFDTSGSMDTQRFPRYKDILKRWVGNYPYENFNVIRFDSEIKPWKPALQAASAVNRKLAASFIDGFQPEGGTDTLNALERAFRMNGVDTIILMSDGQPNGGPPAVIDFVRRYKPDGIVINTVAMGNPNGAHRTFLSNLAALAGGSFQGI